MKQAMTEIAFNRDDYAKRRKADARLLTLLHVAAFLMLLPVVAFSRFSGKGSRGREAGQHPPQKKSIFAETNAEVLSALGIGFMA